MRKLWIVVALVACKEKSKPADPAPTPVAGDAAAAVVTVDAPVAAVVIDAAANAAAPSFDGKWTISLGYDGGDCDEPKQKQLVFEIANETKSKLIDPTGGDWSIAVQIPFDVKTKRDVAINRGYDGPIWRFDLVAKDGGFEVDGNYSERKDDGTECALIMKATAKRE